MHPLFDALRFLNLLTVKKIINFGFQKCLLFASYLIKQPKSGGFPWSLSIEPTSNCNLNCPECPTGKGEIDRDHPEIPFQTYKKIIDQSAPRLIYLLLYFQGEPLLAKNFHNMVAYAKKKRIYTMTSTNGHFLNKTNCRLIVKNGLDRIIVSLDGGTSESYKIYRRGGDFNKVIRGIENLVNEKKGRKSRHPYIILQTIVFKHNQGEIQQIKTLGKRLGVDKVAFKSAQLSDFRFGNEFMPDKKHARYAKINGQYQLKNRSRHCPRLWSSLVFTTDGDALPCCYDKHGRYKMGNILHENIHVIWNAKKLNHFRKKVLKGRNKIEICRNCM